MASITINYQITSSKGEASRIFAYGTVPLTKEEAKLIKQDKSEGRDPYQSAAVRHYLTDAETALQDRLFTGRIEAFFEEGSLITGIAMLLHKKPKNPAPYYQDILEAEKFVSAGRSAEEQELVAEYHKQKERMSRLQNNIKSLTESVSNIQMMLKNQIVSTPDEVNNVLAQHKASLDQLEAEDSDIHDTLINHRDCINSLNNPVTNTLNIARNARAVAQTAYLRKHSD